MVRRQNSIRLGVDRSPQITVWLIVLVVVAGAAGTWYGLHLRARAQRLEQAGIRSEGRLIGAAPEGRGNLWHIGVVNDRGEYREFRTSQDNIDSAGVAVVILTDVDDADHWVPEVSLEQEFGYAWNVVIYALGIASTIVYMLSYSLRLDYRQKRRVRDTLSTT